MPAPELIAFARAHGLLGADEAGEWEPLTGGVSSDIWRLRGAAGEVCIKRALAQLKVAEAWTAPVSRNEAEWDYMETVERIVPGVVPRPVAHDPALGLFAMTWLAPADHPLWKGELFAGRSDPAFAAAMGTLLGRIHAGTAGNPAIAARFATDASFEALRIEPYLLTTASRHPDLADALRGIAAETAATKLALVHGDVSPKNILVGPSGPIVLDAECAWYGDPAFDLAFCLTHLAIKARYLDLGRAEASTSFDRLAAAYLGEVVWERRAVLEARAARLLPALALARVDGKSPVEYLGDSSRAGLRASARRALAAAPSRLSDAKALLLDLTGGR